MLRGSPIHRFRGVAWKLDHATQRQISASSYLGASPDYDKFLSWGTLPGPKSYPPQNSFFSARAMSSPSFTKPNSRRRRKFIPRRAAVQLTEKARIFFKALLENSPEKDGILLNYQQASSGQPRMVFSFSFVTKDELSEEDESVSLEVLEDGSPKPPRESMGDGLPKLFIHHNAFLKVLGVTVDVDTEKISPILYDREGNIVDPND